MKDSVRWKDQLQTKHGIQVLYDADEYFILNKPSGMAIYKSTNQRTKRRSHASKINTLHDILLQQGDIPLSNLNPDGSLGFVHRLDIGTSGCLIVAKTNAMHARLMSQFFLRQVDKSYVALVVCANTATSSEERGNISDFGIVDLAIDQRPAQSTFEVLERYGDLAAKVKVKTRQGRKHQVRLHCSKGLGTPILLDPLYGGEQIMYHVESTTLTQSRARQQFCLHADRLSIPELDVNVETPVPDW